MQKALLTAAVMLGAALAPVAASAQQPVTITGRVTNEAGAPVPSVQVYIQALNLVSLTRDDGNYTLTVPGARATGQTVAIATRQVGFRAATAQVTLTPGQTITQNFQLTAAPITLSTVVVTGAGTTSTRERLGSVINSVDSSLIQRATEPQNVVSALVAKAPNVEIRTQSGDPGSSATMRIRGATSVSGVTNQPLFVVDGQPIDNTTTTSDQSTFPGSAGTVTQNRAADINPNDVESIDILKGSAAAAIYGARAANGVVLITTKRGRPGATRLSFTSTNTFDTVDPNVPLQRSYGLGAFGSQATCEGVDCVPFAVSSNLADTTFGVRESWGARLAPGTRTYDHIDEIYDTGISSDNNLSISGGTERTTFFLSGGLLNQQGSTIGPNNSYTRTSVRLKATHQLVNDFTIGGNFSYIDTRGRYVQKGSNTSGLLLGALRTPPEFNNEQYRDSTSGLHRSYRFPNPSSASLFSSRGYDNPFFVAQNPGNRSELGRFIGNVNLDYNPREWLTFRYTLGSDYYADQRLEAFPLTTSNTGGIGQVSRLDLTNLEIDHNLIATARRQFTQNFDGSITVGQNLNSRRFRQVQALGVGLNAPEPLALQNTLSVSPPQELKTLRHIEAYFAQADFNLYNQLFLNVGIRNDGFSTFGESNRRANYPKAQAAWTFTNALGNTDQTGLLSFGKVRVGYGETGREPTAYSTISTVSLNSLIGSGFQDFILASQSGQGGATTALQAGNPDLKPERNRELEAGFDFGFFDQRADLGVTYYNKRTEDAILPVPVNASQTGSQQQFANAAEITNRGWEITLNARPVTTQNFAWDVGVNWGQNVGRVRDLAGAQFIPYNTEGFTGSIGSSTVGYAPGVIRGSDFVRCGRVSQADLDGDGTLDDVAAACGSAPEGALYLNTRGLPVVDVTDRVIADPNPKWTAGFNTSVRLWNRLRLSGLLDIRHGGQVWNGTKSALYRFGTHKDTEIRSTTGGVMDLPNFREVYSAVAGPGANVDAFQSSEDWESFLRDGCGGSGCTAQRHFVEDGSFVKLREISVSYTFDQPWLRNRVGFGSVDVRLAGRNLATWTDYTGLDPEANLGGAEWFTQGVDFFNNPQTRSFVLSIGLNR